MSDDRAGRVVWDPGKVTPTASPVEAAAVLAQELASGEVAGVHLTLFMRDGSMKRAIFGSVHLPMLLWMCAYVQRDAIAMNDAADAAAKGVK